MNCLPLLGLLGLLSLSACQDQPYFEGTIDYQLRYSPADARIDSVPLREQYGTDWRFVFRKGSFRWDLPNSKNLHSMLYNRPENRLYYLFRNSPVTMWNRGEQETDSVLSMTTEPDSTVILGHRCRHLTIRTRLLLNQRLRTRHYYYAPDLPVRPEWFNGYVGSNFDRIFGVTRALPLRIVDDFGTFVTTYEAVRISPQSLSPTLFTVDPDLVRREME